MIERYFNDQDAFLNHIEEMEKVTDPWYEQKIVDLSNAITLSTNQIVITTPTGTYPLRETSLRSLRQRLGIEFPNGTFVLNNSSANTVCAPLAKEIIDWACKVLKTKDCKDIVKISIVDGKANAFLSKEYVEYINSRYVHNEAFDKIMATTGETEFKFKGWCGYEMSNAEYETSKTKEINGVKYNTVIRVRTSDSGYSCIGIGVLLKHGGKYLPMMSDIDIPHRAGKTKDKAEVKKQFVQNLDTALCQTESVIKEAIAKAEALAIIVLKHPQDAARHIAKDIGLPKVETLKVIENITGNTAWDVYSGLCEILDDSWNIEKRIKTTGNLAKILNVNWTRYDAPFEW